MRALTNEESRSVFSVLSHYIGANLIHLIDCAGQPYCFMRSGDRVYYLPESLTRTESAAAASKTPVFGTFARDGRFSLHINSLDHIAPHAKAKVWVSNEGAVQFLLGYNLHNAYVKHMTKNTPAKHGAVVFTMDGVPLGFGMTARATCDLPKLGEFTPVVQHIANISQTGCAEVRGAPELACPPRL
jgi:60S ribosome subunit biogenesis protein NIP7